MMTRFYEKEVIDGETVMWIDIYYRFIGKIGSEDDGILITPKTRRTGSAGYRHVDRTYGAQ